LLPCLGAGLVIWAGGQNAPALLPLKPLVLLGLISYRLYLWHWPVLVFAGYALLSAPTPAETAGLILLSFALAWATYRFVELPFRRWMDERRVLIFRAGAAVLVLGAGAGATAYLTHGFPGREPVTMAVLRPWDDQGVEHATATIYRVRTCFLLPDQPPTAYSDEKCYGDKPDVLEFGATVFRPTCTPDYPRRQRVIT
jgi:hypothetical protein